MAASRPGSSPTASWSNPILNPGAKTAACPPSQPTGQARSNGRSKLGRTGGAIPRSARWSACQRHEPGSGSILAGTDRLAAVLSQHWEIQVGVFPFLWKPESFEPESDKPRQEPRGSGDFPPPRRISHSQPSQLAEHGDAGPVSAAGLVRVGRLVRRTADGALPVPWPPACDRCGFEPARTPVAQHVTQAPVGPVFVVV
jgi:hypothetical protein